MDEQNIIALRRELHRNPELSGREKETGERIKNFVKQSHPDKVLEDLGGHGLAFVFDSGNPGPVVLFRADLDALPIKEINSFEYHSEHPGVSHKCGHDGHMAILSLLSRKIHALRPKTGKAVLMFQPAEETGEGAEKVIKDPAFQEITPDYAFALHNLPGFRKHDIIIRDETFASASKGIIIKLHGKTSHAGEPENGINPSMAVAEIIKKFHTLPAEKDFKDLTLITMVNVKVGEKAFGTSAGYGEVMATLRSYRNDDMEKLTSKAEEFIKATASKENLEVEIEYTEEFLATENDSQCNQLIEKAAQDNNLYIDKKDATFRWSEDFSHFTHRFKGALFGLGSGIDQPQLHNPDYDFPDEIIETGASIFFSIYKKLLIDKL